MAPSHAGPSNARKLDNCPKILFTKVTMCCYHVIQLSSLRAPRLKATDPYQSQLFDLQPRRAQADNYSFTEKLDR